MHIRKYFYQSLLLMASVFLFGQFAQAVDFKFSAELRPRSEFADRVLGAKSGNYNSFTTTRTRLGVKAIVDSDTSAFIQLQDVRTWGGENPTTAPPSITQTGTSVNTGALNVYRAYIDLANVLGTGIDLKGGRQEIHFDGDRLFGNINWIQQGQSFDAVRGDVNLGQYVNNLSLTTFYGQTVAIHTHPTLASTIANVSTFNSSFAGARLSYKLGDKGDRITPYVYYALNPSRTGKAFKTGVINTSPNVARNIKYVGGFVAKHFNVLNHSVRFRFDGAYEFGSKTTTTNIRAYMLTASLGTGIDVMHGAHVAFWYDYLSGDNNTTDNTDHTFTTPYATNHKFYGLMDKFLNIPTAGLQDIVIKAWIKPTHKMKIAIQLHQFLSQRSGTVTFNKNNALTSVDMPRNLGKEIDLTAIYPLAKKTKLQVGYSHYFGNGTVSANAPGGIHSAGIANSTLNGNWFYAMVDFKI